MNRVIKQNGLIKPKKRRWRKLKDLHTARISWQTDNGSEFIGSARKKIDGLSIFERILKAKDIEHSRIPPPAFWLQNDVETFHRIIEDEGLLNLPPIRLEILLQLCYKEKAKSGYDVPISVAVG